MRQLAPGKLLIEAPTAGNSATCKSCAHCPWMAMNGLANLVACLESGQPAIQVEETIRVKAQGCITRMLDFVAAQRAQAAGMKAGIGAA
jgi:quinolinate synthase